jgi:hypothetical protein
VFKVIPRDLIFDAPAAGLYQLCSGNPKAPARDYDVAALRGSFAKAVLPPGVVSAPSPNPAYVPPPSTASEGEDEGSDINTDPWNFRRVVVLHPSPLVGEGSDGGSPPPQSSPTRGEEASLWRIELDPQAIAHNGGRVEALRLVRNDKQLPYVMDYAGVERSFTPELLPQTAPAKGKSRWLILLPYEGLPVTQLRFTVPNTLFQRTLTLYEVAEEDVDKPMRLLATALWTRVHPDAPSTYSVALQQTPKTKRLILETENGDNAPIHVEKVEAFYRAPRLLFRSKSTTAPLYLYYGQPEVAAPQYDLNLIAAELLSTPPQEARLGKEEALKSTSWWEPPIPSGGGKYLFWGVMILVVLGLLIVIAKLLPEEKNEKA